MRAGESGDVNRESNGLYYKNITNVNDASGVICEWHHNLESEFDRERERERERKEGR